MKPAIGIFIAFAVVAGGYVAYDRLAKDPPSWLVELATSTEPPPPLPAGPVAPLAVPEGFAAYVFSREVPGARVMAYDPKGTLLLSSTKEGKVFALPDLDGDGIADRTATVLEGLDRPHGIYVLCPSTGNVSADQDACTLYVAEVNALVSYAYDADTYTASSRSVLAPLPAGGGGHYTRTILPHPNGEELWISVGSSCNVCRESDPRRATVQAYNLSTGELRTVATGLRNTVFMAIHPVTGEVWGTDNGRDLIGDDVPPDEVNIIREGSDYGWPFCYGKQVPDTSFGGVAAQCAETTPSRIDLPAHSAALGLAFVPEEGWPEDMWHDAIIAYHGSWNRSEPTGYKVVRVDLNGRGEQVGTVTDFVTGFLSTSDENDAIGRPVDILIQPGGVMYVSDDRAGAVYRIVRTRI